MIGFGAKDYIGHEEDTTFLDRELCRSLPNGAAAMSAKCQKQTFETPALFDHLVGAGNQPG
jgi:hypothetical protein